MDQLRILDLGPDLVVCYDPFRLAISDSMSAAVDE